MAKMQPAIFFGHGNPMNAITGNSCTEAWRSIGQETARPEAILSISATSAKFLAWLSFCTKESGAALVRAAGASDYC
jgi:aromatic ring-opening dioxygenase catalytic subunit (LigB family)